jgi:chemotaxis protein methyltransferase WspC
VPLSLLLTHLRQRLGLNPDALSPSALPSAVGRRMRESGEVNLAAYAARAVATAEEFQELVHELVVPETWFLRGGELFFHLADHLRAAAPRPARALSVPCSTGEEPYSLALAVCERGVPRTAWTVDAVDVSLRGLAVARAGRYGDFSFRQVDPALRARYFRAVGGQWEVRADLREPVRFRPGNLVAPDFLAGEAPYDVILCRNLFIYLHPEARRLALANLERLLRPDGVLCMGHAEPLDTTDGRFRRWGPHGFFFYRRDAGGGRARVDAPAAPAPRPRSLPPPLPAHRAPAPAPPVPAAVPADLLAQARDRADEGKLDEAVGLCQESLARSGPSADGYSLLGVLRQAREEAGEARACLEKALYLRPDHEEALTHLMLLYRQQGNEAGAERLRRRLGRAGGRREP